MKVRISEVFTSIEGEGILYGTKTLFVRLAGCPYGCFYCDTPDSLPPGSGTEYSVEDAGRLVDSGLVKNTYKVNFTGGEPLIQHEAVALLAGRVQERGIRTYLESSCFDEARFRHVLPHIDIAKIEFKTRDSGFVDAQHHGKLVEEAAGCLRAALGAGKTTYVKVVVSSGTGAAEFEELVGKILGPAPGEIDGFVIQPVYGEGEPSLEHLMGLYDMVYPRYGQVRVVPQLHKLLGAP